MAPLIPRDLKFFDLFEQQARHANRAAALLEELFADPTRLDETAASIKKVEHEADDATREVITRLNSSFVTPLDREDILLLAARLDNITDRIDGAARRAAEFRIQEPREAAMRLARLLKEATEQVAKAVGGLRDLRSMEEPNRRVKELEEEGDGVYHAAMGELFSNSPDPLEVIKWKDLYDALENALDRCDDVSNALKAISLKHG